MRPILFDAGQTDFTTNGIGRLPDAISCTVTEERNGQYELHMEYPINGSLIGEIRYNRIIVATPADNKAPQPFRIYRLTKPLSGVVEIDAEHISYQMCHIPIMPFSADGLPVVEDAFHTYAAEANPFTFTHTSGFGESLSHSFTVKQPDNLRALLFGQEGSMIDTFGGEWEFDGFNAILHYSRGADRGVTIRYGKNLTDLKQEENIENTYTGICPFWKGQQEGGTDVVVTLPEKVIHSQFALNYPYQRTKIIDMSSSFQSQPTVEQLREKGQAYIRNNDVGSPKVSLDASFVALHQTQEYADLSKIEHINLCDTITVQFPALNVSTRAKVVKTVWNVLIDRYDSITIGAVQSKLSATLMESQERAVEQAVAQSAEAASTEYASKSVVNAISTSLVSTSNRSYQNEERLDSLTGRYGGYLFITIDANRQTDEMYILVDSPVFAAARKMFRINENGLSYTSGGYEHGTWVTVIDGNGKVNGSAVSGILKDAAGKNSWNLVTGAMALAADVTFGGKTMAAIMSELMEDVSEALGTAITAYDTGLTQAKVLEKLQSGTDPETEESVTDNGLYLGVDGLLHMLPERVVTDGANIPVCFIPTTIVGGAVTSYVQARVQNGIIYLPIYHTVTYFDEDGETELGSESVLEGTDCVNIPTPTKTGFVFIGWTDEIGGEADNSLLEDVMEDIRLYAVFEEEEHEEEPEEEGGA